MLSPPIFYEPFNRTIVELKLDLPKEREDTLLAFNRTIVELKQVYIYDADAGKLTFNRTIVELKHVLLPIHLFRYFF